MGRSFFSCNRHIFFSRISTTEEARVPWCLLKDKHRISVNVGVSHPTLEEESWCFFARCNNCLSSPWLVWGFVLHCFLLTKLSTRIMNLICGKNTKYLVWRNLQHYIGIHPSSQTGKDRAKPDTIAITGCSFATLYDRWWTNTRGSCGTYELRFGDASLHLTTQIVHPSCDHISDISYRL